MTEAEQAIERALFAVRCRTHDAAMRPIDRDEARLEAARVADAVLLPVIAHERLRSVVAEALTAYVAGLRFDVPTLH